MARIEGFRVKNFKVLKDVTLGRLWNRRENDPLTPMIAERSGFWRRVKMVFRRFLGASDEPIVNNMVEEGLPLGGLWYSDYLDAR